MAKFCNTKLPFQRHFYDPNKFLLFYELQHYAMLMKSAHEFLLCAFHETMSNLCDGICIRLWHEFKLTLNFPFTEDIPITHVMKMS